MAQIQIRKLAKKEEGEKKVEEGLELEGYTEILQDIKSLLEKARYRAYKAVDNLRVKPIGRLVRELSEESCNTKKEQITVSGLLKIYQSILTSKGEIFIEWYNFTGHIQL